MSDKAHSRVLSNRNCFHCLHLLGAYLLLGVIHFCPSTSFSLFTGDFPTIAKRSGKRIAIMQV